MSELFGRPGEQLATRKKRLAFALAAGSTLLANCGGTSDPVATTPQNEPMLVGTAVIPPASREPLTVKLYTDDSGDEWAVFVKYHSAATLNCVGTQPVVSERSAQVSAPVKIILPTAEQICADGKVNNADFPGVDFTPGN